MERRKKVLAESTSDPQTIDQTIATESLQEQESKEVFLVEQAKWIARKLGLSTASLVQKNVGKEAQKVVEYAEAIQSLAADEAGNLLKATMEIKREKASSEAAASEAGWGNSSIHISDNNTIDLNLPSPSQTSDIIHDIPWNGVYKTLDKVLPPSPSTKTTKKPDNVDESEEPSINERIGNLFKQIINICQNLPADHWLQPSCVKPFQTLLPHEEFEYVQTTSDNITSTSSQPKPTT